MLSKSCFVVAVCTLAMGADKSTVLTGTQPLTVDGDLAAQMVAGLDRYLLRELDGVVAERQALWRPVTLASDTREPLLKPFRERLARIIGVVDSRRPFEAPDVLGTTAQPPLVARGEGYVVRAVRWPVIEGVDGEGLLLEPEGTPRGYVVALPDADWSPEQLVGLTPGVPQEAQFARRLVENGLRVLVPTLIDRADTWSGCPGLRSTNQPHREFVYRAAYVMGRHIIGYEVQKVLAAVDWFTSEAGGQDPSIAVIGYGEGGLIALFSAALDPRIDVTAVSGYFQPREQVWREPIYRNVWSQLRQFGDAELLAMIAPRQAIVEVARHPESAGPPPVREGRSGAAPGVLATPAVDAVRAEFERARKLAGEAGSAGVLKLVISGDGTDAPGCPETLRCLLEAMRLGTELKPLGAAPTPVGAIPDADARMKRQFDQLNECTQRLLRTSTTRRQAFWSKADASSLERWAETTQGYRQYLHDEVIGRLPPATLPPNPRTRLILDELRWRAYEVVLDVHPDVMASGILLVPKDIRPDERRPVVVCQHGLEGRAIDAVARDGPGFKYYKAFAAQLADRGFVTYAPQNPYIGGDAFRTVQRKANPLKLSLYSFIVRQHEQTVQWLGSLPFVDARRIGFYGLSYGGKTAMRVPALLPDLYALSICSGDFNEWIVKLASISDRFSYMFVGEYEIFDFDLGNTFNYAEMAGLIAPRPFMVERGHRDPVAIDEWVAYEYAKVRRLYADLGIADRTEIEYFNGPHEINAKGTASFLHRHLGWPEPAPSDQAEPESP